MNSIDSTRADLHGSSLKRRCAKGDRHIEGRLVGDIDEDGICPCSIKGQVVGRISAIGQIAAMAAHCRQRTPCTKRDPDRTAGCNTAAWRSSRGTRPMCLFLA